MKRVILDVDVGTDDAHALLLVLHADKIGKIKLEAIICSTGNTKVEHVTKNVVRLLEKAGRTDIPIYQGVHEQLILPDRKLQDFHGEDGFGDLHYDEEPDLSAVRKEPAVMYLGNTVTSNPGEFSVVCLGPLTNLALAFKMFSRFAECVKDIFIMGGNHQGIGNTTACAEYNFYFDPESAYITLEKAKCPVSILTWETSLLPSIPFDWRFNVLGEINNPMLQLINAAEKSIYGTDKDIWLACDAFLMMAFLNSESILKQSQFNASVELHGYRTRGQLILDHLKEHEPNVTIIEEIDAELFKSALLKAAIETM